MNGQSTRAGLYLKHALALVIALIAAAQVTVMRASGEVRLHRAMHHERRLVRVRNPRRLRGARTQRVVGRGPKPVLAIFTRRLLALFAQPSRTAPTRLSFYSRRRRSRPASRPYSARAP